MAQSNKSKRKKNSEYRLPGGWKAFVVMVIALVCLCVALLGYELFNRYLKPYFVKDDEVIGEVYQDLPEETTKEEELESGQVSESKISLESVPAADSTEELLEEAEGW